MHLVMRRAREEVLQRTTNFLRQAVHKRIQHAGLIVLGQVIGQLLLLGFFKRKAVLAGDQAGQLGATKRLVAVVQQFLVPQHLEAGRFGPDLEQRDQRILALIGQGRHQPADGHAGGMRFDVEHHGLQAGRFRQALAVLDAILARGGDQHLDVAHRSRARANDAEVQTDLVERERDVLVGLGFHLQLELFFPEAGRQHDAFGDHGRLGHRQRRITSLGAAAGHHAPHGIGHLVEFLDLPVGNPALLEGLARKAFQHELATLGLAQFHQLDAGGADIETDQGRVLATQKCVKYSHALCPRHASNVSDY
mmetsp:Transcript_18076/g.43210  ORF Transcript_18076/g.43210 Transcript_18076/m.43210 type:complete len:307 (-) Transcript_18076:822-1742(-)